jgi:hypothetical protein
MPVQAPELRTVPKAVLSEDRDRRMALPEAVRKFTEQLFGAPARIHPESDPDVAGEYLVVSVAARGEVEDIVALNHQWHAKLVDVAGDLAERYRLSLELP